MRANPSRKVWIRGSGGGVRMSVLYIGVIPLSCFAVGAIAGHLEFLPVLLIAGAVAVRTAFMGVYLKADQLVVASWFRTWRFEVGDVKKVVWRRYRGFYNRYVEDDTPLTWIWMIGLAVEVNGNRRLRFFPSTVGSRSRVERVAGSIAESLGVRAVSAQESLAN
jgi:hypothetical protein